MIKLAIFGLVTLFNGFSCIENNLAKTSEILLNLTNYAVESRQIGNPCIYAPNQLAYMKCISKLRRPYRYGHQNFEQYPQNPQNPQNVMDVLYTIANNDALRCVPRLLCEVTSDAISTRRQGFSLPKLPFNLDTTSIIRLLSTFDIAGGYPLPFFAKAALLGYASKGNTDSCLEAYPQCPRDANKLVQYLNNYNGGFFRFFNGVNRYQNDFPDYYHQNMMAQKRIQTRPPHFDAGGKVVVFSDNEAYNRFPKTLTFPVDGGESFGSFNFKKPKELPFSINDYYSNELDLQRPLPNHKATPVIFPVRTGTGELLLDEEELNDNYKQIQYNLQNNNFISFRPSDEDFYYRRPEGSSLELNTNKAVFSFPV